ncbi:MAG: 23S rRNA (adenine(2503)-C(2))-methyltransferase RlmN [Actinomycetota bacterium]|nr:23S rRNA (adenine(2503)-C(2))-methyltransferase RlmN [Actinomycetota bacterium]
MAPLPWTTVVARYGVEVEALADLLVDHPGYRVGQVWDGLYRRLLDPLAMTDLPAGLRQRLHEELPDALAPVQESVSDDGATVKWLWRLHDGAQIETVLMHYDDRSTVCVSSQAGCAMACSFCATGQSGFERNLAVGEIVEQVVRAARRARPRRVSNVVFMGMGEPLANYDRLWAALRRLHGDLGLSARHLTVSTIGVVPGIDRLAHEDLPVNLAVSLHAANDADRARLVPLNRRYPLAELTAACARYVEATGRRLSFEWALIDATNDRPGDAIELAALARPLRAHVNLIPLNPTPAYATPGTPLEGVRSFCRQLRELGVNATVRHNRGTGIDAACGQLRAAQPPRPTRTVNLSPTRTASTSTSPARTTPAGQTTERTRVPSTTAPDPTTDSPPDAARLAAR